MFISEVNAFLFFWTLQYWGHPAAWAGTNFLFMDYNLPTMSTLALEKHNTTPVGQQSDWKLPALKKNVFKSILEYPGVFFE